MKRFAPICLALLFSFPLIAGCNKTTEVKKETTVTTPDGKTTTTETKKIEKSGENPPPGN